ncbi:segment polarity protein dishevelled homolog DVL-1 isoform X4 [Cricetulus griseus]|uniref:Dishevelled segment polarity protein 1 n=1 Tax=Cricetulus griseus TaxID=10029 RepID=G3I423_CRIGR|nr:segment polarity protein dishevelled homolog DVL-1 isoform X4 [Cricetulus griseus]XP_027254385.1 segment polarity protein dishevelled homolog DVL-1 isoform X4 [Cricetulus griseus]EGW07784.1 Segment polarity protein dishevelled-like DVL-1 [Cricetulus griseus]ERE84260.1 putative segment polarity protein dishevelledVL-1-like protein [Cricetulus griseus]
MAETKIIYHMDEEETPYLVKLPVAPERVTLADFKNVLSNRPVHAYKFFFKSMDQDFGVVKEEIFDDNAKLPCFNGRVVSWLVLAEGAHSDAGSQGTDSHTDLPPPLERTGGIGDSRPPSFHPNVASSRDGMDNETGTESMVSHRRERARRRNRDEASRTNGHPRGDRRRDLGLPPDSASTVLSSELESSSFIDSDEEDNTSRLSSSTEQSTSSRLIRKHKCRRRKQRLRQTDRASSFSSITDSTMSLNIITVTLNMERHHFLGISIVGQSNDRGDGGIYIGSIMKGGAVAADGRIEPGDMLLQVNDVNFENMSNDDAVRVLREIVSQTGPISLTVAKCWDPTPRSYFTIPRADPVRPIDPAAWLSHTAALTGALPRYGTSPCSSAITRTSSSSLTSSVPGAPQLEEAPLTVKSDMSAIVRVMQLPDSGLEIRDRMWLKITIANAVIGADVVDWLYTHVEGFRERREARKYASSMLKRGFLRHTVNKITFSEQCYYVFGDLCTNLASLNLNSGSSGASDQDTLAPLPHPSVPWPLGQGYPYQYPGPPPCFPPAYQDPGFSYGSGSAGSQQSEGSKSSGSTRSSHRTPGREERRAAGAGGSGSESDHTAPSGSGSTGWWERPVSQLSHGSSPRSQASAVAPGLPPLHPLTKAYAVVGGPPGGPPVRELAAVPPELTGSRQSFQKAMGNPCEFFVDIM